MLGCFFAKTIGSFACLAAKMARIKIFLMNFLWIFAIYILVIAMLVIITPNCYNIGIRKVI